MTTRLATSPGLLAPSRPGEFRRPERRVLVAVRWPVGGIRTHILYNYPTLAERGYRFTFVGPGDETFDRFAESTRLLEGSEHVGVPVRGPRCRMAPVLRRLLRTGRFALLHSHGVTAAIHGSLAAPRAVPHVATVHDVFRPDQFPGLRGALKRWIMGRLLRRVRLFVLPGYDAHANLLQYLPVLGRGPCRLEVVPNGIDADHYARGGRGGQDLRRELGLSPGTVLVGFLGRFMKQKGFLPLLAALERLVAAGAPRPFHLVAFATGDYGREYAAEIQGRGLSDHVTVRPAVPDAQPVLAQLDLLVMPSLWEAMPLLPMEAMAAGVPVLGSDCVGLREVLLGTPSRMVRAGDAEELARGLRDALASPWAEAARDFAPRARERFDNARSADVLAGLFDRTAAVR
jgi:glycosyltransferase involved in cell wall biosynthesis